MAELHSPNAILYILRDVSKSVGSMISAVQAAKRAEEAMVATHEHPDYIEIEMQKLYDAISDMKDHAKTNLNNANLTTFPPFVTFGSPIHLRAIRLLNNSSGGADQFQLLLDAGADQSGDVIDVADIVRITGTGTKIDGRRFTIDAKTGQIKYRTRQVSRGCLTFADGMLYCLDIARMGHVTRARVTQIMNLLHLAPDIQEELLNLPRLTAGHESIPERRIRPIAAEPHWARQ